jgi:hypothetical protein
MEAMARSNLEADNFLRENPGLKAVHSAASIRAMLGAPSATAVHQE